MKCRDNESMMSLPAPVRAIAVVGGDAPMSVPCVYDACADTFHVGANVPADAFAAHVGHCVLHRAASMRALVTRSTPVIGLPQRVDYVLRSAAYLEGLGPVYQGVAPARILQAIREVPEQREAWTCGVNSGARFAAMLGQSLKHYWPYVRGAPKYGFAGVDIGPNAEGLQNHLRRQSELAGTDVHQVCNVRFHGLWESMINSVVEKRRPALVLLMESETSMHWVCIVGRNRDTGHWYYLNTDNTVVEIPGGDDELKHRMNMDNCWAQRLNFVERFNCIVSTGDCCEKD